MSKQTEQDATEAAVGQSALNAELGDDRKLRYLLFMGHGHEGYPMCLYGDDGEMQCGVCFCDFVRDTPDELQRKMERWWDILGSRPKLALKKID